MNRSTIRVAAVVLEVLAIIAFTAYLFGGGQPYEREQPPQVVERDSEISEDIVGVGQSIEVVGRVRGGVLALGGDVYVTGIVDGDVAAVGGSVHQFEGSRIGGDVLVAGGQYLHGAGAEGRVEGKNTLIFAGNPESYRNFFANPTRELLAPRIDRAFIGWRVAAAFFSLVFALVIVAIAPGAVSRTSERLVQQPLRIALIGLIGTAVVLLFAVIALRLLSAPLAALVLVPVLAALLVAQVFGRVVAYFIVGRWIQTRLFRGRNRSQAVALVLGVMSLAFLGSLPVIGALVLFGTFILSTGLVLTVPRRAPATNLTSDS